MAVIYLAYKCESRAGKRRTEEEGGGRELAGFLSTAQRQIRPAVVQAARPPPPSLPLSPPFPPQTLLTDTETALAAGSGSQTTLPFARPPLLQCVCVYVRGRWSTPAVSCASKCACSSGKYTCVYTSTAALSTSSNNE